METHASQPNSTRHLRSAEVQREIRWFLSQAKPRRLRSMRQFAEEEIVLPSGPFAGSRFRVHRQPFTGLWFDEVDSGRWSRFVATGPTQSGKTIACFVIPLLYHLFEYGETVICGLPDMDMATDKWREDLLPIIERSRYRDQLPKQGSGSRGGLVQSLQFRNGATLKFMSGGGGDKSRAGFTSRVVVISETDGMDENRRNSREADKISQLTARTKAFGKRARIYMECTVSTETGRTWQEYVTGSRSRIALLCPWCEEWVTPERESLQGWHESTSHAEAGRTSHFECPVCGKPWSHEQRVQANQMCKLVHHQQTIADDGTVLGDLPQTDTLGFRWSAVNNLFLSAGEIGADEWRASRSSDEENAERERRQFVWCLPVVPDKWQETDLEAQELMQRTSGLPRGVLPEDVKFVTAGLDLGKYLNHWIVVAWTAEPFAYVVDYGRIEVASQDLGVEQATMVALRQFRDLAKNGWLVGSKNSEIKMSPNITFVDSGYMTDVVYAFRREAGDRFMPAVGRGAAQQRQQWYNRPAQLGAVVRYLGEGFHVNRLPREKLSLAEVDADHWKTWVHQRLTCPTNRPGAMLFYQASTQDHFALAKHLTAEVKTEEFVAGKGLVVKWERKRRQNHWFDALYNACAAGSYVGVKLVQEVPPPPKPKLEQEESDGQSWASRDAEMWRAMQKRIWGG